jgi:hypothetical protein
MWAGRNVRTRWPADALADRCAGDCRAGAVWRDVQDFMDFGVRHGGSKPMRQPRRRPGKAKPSSYADLLVRALASLEEAGATVEERMPSRGERRSSRRVTAKGPARMTVRSACVAARQRYSRSRGNPMHVWEAIWMCTSPAVAPMELPAWCIAYLHETAKGLLAAKGDGEKLAAFISRQLGFTRSGWTAVKARASATRAIRAALLYDEHCYNGFSSERAFEKVRENESLADVSSARKLVRAGKDMLSHIPEDA